MRDGSREGKARVSLRDGSRESKATPDDEPVDKATPGD